MDVTPQPGLTEILANLSIASVFVIIACFSLVRLTLVRSRSGTARNICEVCETAITVIALVYLLIRPFLFQAYFIPSASMEPTLLGNDQVSDKIIVNKCLYRFHPPHDEDVVLFLAPRQAVPGDPVFIKRLIGRPGDRISVTGGHVVIDGTAYNHEQVRDALAKAGIYGSEAETAGVADQSYDHAKFVPGGVLANGTFIPASRLGALVAGLDQAQVSVEPGYVVRNGTKLVENYTAEDPDYDMKIEDGEPFKRDYGKADPGQQYTEATSSIEEAAYDSFAGRQPEPIPAGKYLMMGDNRNDSYDGTCWGLLDQDRIVGKAAFIFWPPSRIRKVR